MPDVDEGHRDASVQAENPHARERSHHTSDETENLGHEINQYQTSICITLACLSLSVKGLFHGLPHQRNS